VFSITHPARGLLETISLHFLFLFLFDVSLIHVYMHICAPFREWMGGYKAVHKRSQSDGQLHKLEARLAEGAGGGPVKISPVKIKKFNTLLSQPVVDIGTTYFLFISSLIFYFSNYFTYPFVFLFQIRLSGRAGPEFLRPRETSHGSFCWYPNLICGLINLIIHLKYHIN
jgi:hypothetical protein